MNTLSRKISELKKTDELVVELADEELKIITVEELEKWKKSAIEFDGFYAWVVRGKLNKL